MKTIEAFDPCEHILVVAAHGDDLETMCGGTIVKLLAQGKTVDLLIATDGDLGSSDRMMERPALSMIRREEARRAGTLLGLREIRFLGYRDGELVNDLTLRKQLAQAYRSLQPDTVFTFDPLSSYRDNLHPDHTAIGQSAIDAFMPAKMPLYHPEQLGGDAQLSRVQHIFCFVTPEPDVLVAVDDVYDRKLAASMAHESQFPRGEEDLDWMKARDRRWAEHLPEGGAQYIEAFRSITTY